jgi:hypothetical protein
LRHIVNGKHPLWPGIGTSVDPELGNKLCLWISNDVVRIQQKNARWLERV